MEHLHVCLGFFVSCMNKSHSKSLSGPVKIEEYTTLADRVKLVVVRSCYEVFECSIRADTNTRVVIRASLLFTGCRLS